MGRRMMIAASAALAAALLAGVAVSLGAGRSQAPQGPGATSVQTQAVSAPAYEVSRPHGGARATRATQRRQVAIRYYETNKPIDLATGTQYFKFSGKPCPKNAKAISGYSYYAGSALPPQLVANAGDAPMTLRNWQFYLSNPNPDEIDEAIKFGVICAKHVD